MTQCTGPEQDKVFKHALEVVDKWLETGPTQMATAIRELLDASREQRDPQWMLVEDTKIRTIAQEQWFLHNSTIMWGFFHTSWNEVIKRHQIGT